MIERLITQETSSLAREKGFSNIKSVNLYGGEHVIETRREVIPTQSLLQKWLRDEHKIECLIMLNMNNQYSCHIYKNCISINKDKNIWEGEGITPTGNNYEKVLERGLYEALKLV